jgi:hypothetical protein
VVTNSPHLPDALVELFVSVACRTGDRKLIAGREQCVHLRADAYVDRERHALADNQHVRPAVHAAKSR